MVTGMSTSCFFGRLTVEDSIDIMGKMGVKKAEVFLNTFYEYRPAYVKELKKHIEDSGIRVLSLHPHGVQYEPQLFSLYERSRSDAMDIYKMVLEAAAELGARIYVCHGGIALKKAGKALNMERIAGIVDELCDTAHSFGVRFCYENVHWCWFKTPRFAEELLALCKNPYLGFTLDVKQAAQSRIPIDEYIAAMDDRLANLHICDFITQQDSVRPVLPPLGELDALRLIELLRGYSGAGILEVYGDNYRDFDELKHAYELFSEQFAGGISPLVN